MLRKLLFRLALAGVILSPGLASAAVDFQIVQTLSLTKEPLDAVASPDKKHVYVLTPGELLVFNTQGQQTGAVSVGSDVKALRIGSGNDTLILLSPDKEQVRIARIDFVYTFHTAERPVKGNPKAPVEVVVFSDFQCSYCAKLAPVFQQVIDQYPDKVKVVFKHYPLASHPQAIDAALAATAAHKMGKFWEFHDRLFQNSAQLNDQKIDQIAAELKLDPAAFKKHRDSDEAQRIMAQDMEDGDAAELGGTPSVYVNGRKTAKNDLNAIQTAINAELKRLSAGQ